MTTSWFTTLLIAFTTFSASSSPQTPLVTGNGFGYAVISDAEPVIQNLWSHPYRFRSPNTTDQTAEGIPTSDLIRKAQFELSTTQRPKYLNQSHVISAGGPFTQSFFAPFSLSQNALVVISTPESPRQCLRIEWRHPLLSHTQSQLDTHVVHEFTFADTSERVLAIGKKGSRPDCDLPGSFWILSILSEPHLRSKMTEETLSWLGNTSPSNLTSREVRAFEKWRQPPNVCFRSKEEHRLYRQSETILRMGQIRENTHHGFGLINASLPNGEWFIPWVRDMAYATVALSLSGHKKEARQSLLAQLNARPTGKLHALTNNSNYQISTVRYFGDGSEENDFSGQSQPNLEFDSWGLFLWSTAEYLRLTRDRAFLHEPTYRGQVYENIRDHVITPLLNNLEPFESGLIVAKDTSVWEQNDMPFQHYAASTIAAYAGLNGIAPYLEAIGDNQTAAKIRQAIRLLNHGFHAAFFPNGIPQGTAEGGPRNKMDGALLDAINFKLSSFSATQTILKKMPLLQTPLGGFRRTLGSTLYEKQEFVLVNINMARALLRVGQISRADSIIATLTEKASRDSGLVPETYLSNPDSDSNQDYSAPIGSPSGSKPMVGFGAGAYMIYMHERTRLNKNKNCLYL